MNIEKEPRFSFDADKDAWKVEARRIIEEENWEEDGDVMNIHSAVRTRIEELGDQADMSAGGLDEFIDGFEKEETLQFVQNFPEKAAHYTELWEHWAALADLAPDIEDNEWTTWKDEHLEAKYMGQYRSIARASRGL